ncbi:MAG: trehalose-phosphatase [Acidimicrobiales bacterium]
MSPTHASVLEPGQLRRALSRIPADTSLFSDFDGTLAPIVADPAAAAPLPGTVNSLVALARHYRRIAVLSGRPLSYLDPLLPAAVDIGALYGLEQRRGAVAGEHPEAARWRPVVNRATSAASRRFIAHRGVTVEAKGLSLTVHYRNATDPAAAAEVQHWAQQESGRTGLLARGAKASVELHPPVTVDKGSVLTAWAQGSQVVAFFGDDVGDLTAFAALRHLAAHERIETYAVVIASEETPSEVLAAADVILQGPPALAALLEGLVADLAPPT